MLDMGIPLAAGSDGTVAATPNPWPCIAWLVTGETVDGSAPRAPEQLIDIDEALRLYTNASAWFSFEEGTRGTLRPGSHADLAVLAQDPLRVDPTSLSSIESALTIVGGEIVHSTLDSASVAP
jgi:predicted amidohydrolase YtcJ